MPSGAQLICLFMLGLSSLVGACAHAGSCSEASASGASMLQMKSKHVLDEIAKELPGGVKEAISDALAEGASNDEILNNFGPGLRQQAREYIQQHKASNEETPSVGPVLKVNVKPAIVPEVAEATKDKAEPAEIASAAEALRKDTPFDEASSKETPSFGAEPKVDVKPEIVPKVAEATEDKTEPAEIANAAEALRKDTPFDEVANGKHAAVAAQDQEASNASQVPAPRQVDVKSQVQGVQHLAAATQNQDVPAESQVPSTGQEEGIKPKKAPAVNDFAKDQLLRAKTEEPNEKRNRPGPERDREEAKRHKAESVRDEAMKKAPGKRKEEGGMSKNLPAMNDFVRDQKSHTKTAQAKGNDLMKDLVTEQQSRTKAPQTKEKRNRPGLDATRDEAKQKRMEVFVEDEAMKKVTEKKEAFERKAARDAATNDMTSSRTVGKVDDEENNRLGAEVLTHRMILVMVMCGFFAKFMDWI